jgi:hypothetical protein
MNGQSSPWYCRARGLTGLTESALAGIRNMPAHGGDMTLSDIEIERAITWMVNQSSGNWIEPIDAEIRSAILYMYYPQSAVAD